MTQRRNRSASMWTGGIGVFAGCAAAAMAQQGGPVQVGDIAFGLSRSSVGETAQLVRDCELSGGWTALPFLQSMEFDNLDGRSHNANGNLLALNFGTTGGGGSLASLSTDGSDAGSTIFLFDGNGGTPRTRVGGVSVSPDNDRVAAIGYDTGDLMVLDYAPGAGDGTGAITGAASYGGVAAAFATQGTAWLDADSVLAYSVYINGGDTRLRLIDADTGSEVDELAISVRTLTGNFTDVEYNPTVSPFIYCLHSSFLDGTTQNTLTVVDPGTFSIVKQVTLDASMNTGREIALGPDGNLYLSAYGGADAVGPFIDTLPANPNQIVNDGSVDCYQAVGISSSFNGLDVAVEAGAGGDELTLTVGGACPGTVTVAWENATPNSTLALIFAQNTGSVQVPPGNPCAGTQLGLGANQIQEVNRFPSGANGSGQRNGQTGASACGGFLQLLEVPSCDTSNVDQIP